jgi:hypothetical protein
MRAWFAWLVAEWRFGRARKMESRGKADEAFRAYAENRLLLATALASDAPRLSLRLMNLARLAEVSRQLGRDDVLKSALEEWVTVWDSACRAYPRLANVESLVRLESWVRAMLSASK